MTITKSITIADDGTGTAGILASGTSGAVINAGVNDKITLRGLTFNGVNTGINGVVFNSGSMLSLENVRITGFTNYGVLFQPSTAGRMHIEDTTIENNGTGTTGGGVLVRPVSTGSAAIDLNTVRLVNNVLGLRLENSVAGTGPDHRRGEQHHGRQQRLFRFRRVPERHWPDHAQHRPFEFVEQRRRPQSRGRPAIIRVSNSMITGNATGITSSTTNLMSYGNNHVDDNTTPGITMPIIPSK